MLTKKDIDAIGDEQRQELILVYHVAKALRSLELDEILRRIDFAETWGPFADPTLFMAKAKAMSEDKSVVQILARAKHELDKLPWPDR